MGERQQQELEIVNYFPSLTERDQFTIWEQLTREGWISDPYERVIVIEGEEYLKEQEDAAYEAFYHAICKHRRRHMDETEEIKEQDEPKEDNEDDSQNVIALVQPRGTYKTKIMQPEHYEKDNSRV